LIVVGGVDVDTDLNLTGILKAPYTSSATTNITPLTTLVSAMVDKNMSVATAYAQVAKALNLTPAIVKANPVKLANDGNTTASQTAMTIQRVITTMAKAAGVSNSDIYSHLVTAINHVADGNTSNKSITAIVTAAADDANSTLPQKTKKAAKVANVIATTVKYAFNKNQGNIKDAALISSNAAKKIQTALDSNKTIADIKSIANTALTVNPVNIAVSNLLSSYGVDANATEISSISADFSGTSDINVTNILNNSTNKSITVPLAKAYTAQQIKLYIEKNGQTPTPTEVTEIASLPGITYKTLGTMSLADFSKKLHNSGKTDLMALSLKLSPPPSIASMSDIQKAKALFTSVRTQVHGAQTFAQDQSTKIDAALSGIVNNVNFTSAAFATMNNMIGQALDAHQTTISRLINHNDRNVTVTKVAASSGNIAWKYTVSDANNPSNKWEGLLTYTNIRNPQTFNPSKFTKVNVTLKGTMPIGYYGIKIPAGEKNSQNVNAALVVNKTNTGATFNLNAAIVDNNNNVKITDANLAVAYTVDTNATLHPQYMELKSLHVNGTVGDYTLDGQLDAPSYTVNKINEAKGFSTQTNHYYFGISAKCDNNSILQANNVKYNGMSPNWYNLYNGATTIALSWSNMTSAPINVSNISNYTGLVCSNGSIPKIFDPWKNSWTNDSFQNSGNYPSEITFDGKLTNNATTAYLNAKIDAKWTNIADANLSSNTYKPDLDITANGTLARPSYPDMKVNLGYIQNATDKTVNVTYVNGDTSITAKSVMPQNNNGNATVDISSTSGIIAKIVTVHGKIDYKASTLTNTSGKTVGYFEDRAGVPIIKYQDGTFESLY